MPKAYIVAHIRIHDPETFERFKSMSGPAIKDFGGRVLVRNPNIDHREGAATGTCIIVEFDSLEQARAFYESEAYTAARLVREEAAETDLVIVEGV
ncbi:DUF1330 domain-containing protein [Ruegeria pomeroyi]|uniref:DUF1330 domain-containing protein n=1 Tax=Ruegeria pomeroyi TaxID=89184 RepID=A0A9Q3WNV6_9RHOB|nr:DUF1330 domain-containing protein [Ruegeria pomeroyi]MCE8539409.1 DUF1330 domain-containing protein [Ruegeria pomeroyi]